VGAYRRDGRQGRSCDGCEALFILFFVSCFAKELSDESLSFEDDLVDDVPKHASVVKKKALSRFQLCMLHSSIDKEDQVCEWIESGFICN
jgi:hypothetical protein